MAHRIRRREFLGVLVGLGSPAMFEGAQTNKEAGKGKAITGRLLRLAGHVATSVTQLAPVT